MKKLLLVLYLFGYALFARASTVNCGPPASSPERPNCPIVTASGTVIVVQNGPLTFNGTFEEIFTGSPASVSVTIVGLSPGGTASATLNTNTSTANTVVSVNSTTVVYTSYQVTVTWTGGTNVTFQLNPVLSTARNGSGGAGFTTAAQVVAAFAGCSGVQYLGADTNCHNASGLPTQFTTNGTTTITGSASAIFDLHAGSTGGLLLPGALATGLVGVTTSTGAISIFNAGNLIPVSYIPTAIPIANVGSAGLSGSSPITISAAGAIACATCGVTGTGLNQFAATTSAQFFGVISDETGSGLVVGNNGPTLIAPILGTPASGTLTNALGLPVGGIAAIGANTTVANVTGGSAVPTAASIPAGIQNYVSGTGYNQATSHQMAAPLACNDASGSGTAQTCSTSPTFTPAAKDCVNYTPGTTITGALTLNVNASSAAPVQKWLGSALVSGDLVANKTVLACYDGTNWQVQTIGNAPTGSGNTTSTSLTSGTLPKANGANSIINSLFTDTGTAGGYTGTSGFTASGGLIAGNPAGGVGSQIFLTQEGTIPTGLSAAGQDNCYSDSTQNGILCNFNAGTTLPLLQGPASDTSNALAKFSGTKGGKVVGSTVIDNATTVSTTEPFVSSTYNTCPDTSASGSAQVCNTTPTFTPVAGSCIAYTTTTANTGTGLTLNVNSLGAKSVAKWQGSTILAANDVLANKEVVACYDGTNWELATIGNAPGGAVSSVNTLTGAVVIEAATAGQMAVSGGSGAALTGAADMTYTTHTFATTANGIFDWSAATGVSSFKLPSVIGGSLLAGTSTANLSAPIVIQNTNSSNNNTSITMGITAPGTSTGQTVLNVNGASTGGDLQDWGTGGTWASGVLSGQTNVAAMKPSGALSLGTATCTVFGTAGGICPAEGTAPTNVAGAAPLYPDSTKHEYLAATNGSSSFGMMNRSQPGAIHTTGLVASVSTATLCAASAGACNQAGQYHVHLDMYQSGTACTSNATGGVSFQLTWTDGNGTAHSAQTIPIIGNSLGTTATGFITNGLMLWGATTLGSYASGDIVIATNGTVVQYATTFSQCSTTGTATYVLDVSVVREQ